MKNCSKCKIVKPFEDFYRYNRTPSKRYKGGLEYSSQCKNCAKQTVKDCYRRRPALHMLERAKQRSRKKGFEFNLTVEDIEPLPSHCPVFGFSFEPNNGTQNPKAYSLDRIDSSKGYVKGNVAVISYLANRLKNNGTIKQHRQIADWMEKMKETTK